MAHSQHPFHWSEISIGRILQSSFLPFQKFLATNTLKPIIDRELALTEEEMRDAISYLATHRARGKVVINMAPTRDFRNTNKRAYNKALHLTAISQHFLAAGELSG